MKKLLFFSLIMSLLLLAACGDKAGADAVETPAPASPVPVSTPVPEDAPVPAETEDPVDYEAILETEGGDGQGEAGARVSPPPGSGDGLSVSLSADLAAEFSQWIAITLDGDGDSELSAMTLGDALASAGTWSVVTASDGLADEMTGVSLTITALSGNKLTLWADTDLVRYVECDQPLFYRTGSSLYYRVLPWAKAELSARERAAG